MAYCSKCGTELTEGAKFCPKCGNPIGSTQTKEKVSKSSSNYNLELVSVGFAKLQVVKALREIFGIGLKEAKDIVDSTPLEIAKDLTLTEAKKIASLLSAAGAKSVVKQNGKTIFIEEPSQNFNSQTEEQGGNKLMKYGAYVFGALCFLYILGTCVGDGSDGKEETQTVQKQEKKESNPYAKFMGKYVLYDDEGRTSFFHFKVDKKGNFLQSIGITDEYNNYGPIDIVSDDAFCVSLFGTTKIYIDHDDENWPWANTDKVKCGMRHKYFGPNVTLRIDIKEKRLYPDNEEYKNREYKLPHYYKFRFTKQ